MKPKVKISKPIELEPTHDLVMLLDEKEEYTDKDSLMFCQANLNSKLGFAKLAKLYKIEYADFPNGDINLTEWRERLRRKLNDKRF